MTVVKLRARFPFCMSVEVTPGTFTINGEDYTFGGGVTPDLKRPTSGVQYAAICLDSSKSIHVVYGPTADILPIIPEVDSNYYVVGLVFLTTFTNVITNAMLTHIYDKPPEPRASIYHPRKLVIRPGIVDISGTKKVFTGGITPEIVPPKSGIKTVAICIDSQQKIHLIDGPEGVNTFTPPAVDSSRYSVVGYVQVASNTTQITNDNIVKYSEPKSQSTTKPPETTGNELDMGGNRIINVGTPVTGTDAATKGYVDNDIENNLTVHTSDTDNPHQVTLEQARSVNNQLAGDIDANNHTIKNLAEPVDNNDAATKNYVDTHAGGSSGASLPDTTNNQGKYLRVSETGNIIWDTVHIPNNTASGSGLEYILANIEASFSVDQSKTITHIPDIFYRRFVTIENKVTEAPTSFSFGANDIIGSGSYNVTINGTHVELLQDENNSYTAPGYAISTAIPINNIQSITLNLTGTLTNVVFGFSIDNVNFYKDSNGQITQAISVTDIQNSTITNATGLMNAINEKVQNFIGSQLRIITYLKNDPNDTTFTPAIAAINGQIYKVPTYTAEDISSWEINMVSPTQTTIVNRTGEAKIVRIKIAVQSLRFQYVFNLDSNESYIITIPDALDISDSLIELKKYIPSTNTTQVNWTFDAGTEYDWIISNPDLVDFSGGTVTLKGYLFV